MSEQVDQLLATIRKRHPEASEREAQLFEFVWRMYPYMTDRRTGAQVINLETGESLSTLIDNWAEENYGLRFTTPRKRKPA